MTPSLLLAVATPVGTALFYFLMADAIGWDEAVGCAITLAITCPFAVAVGRTRSVPMLVSGRGAWTIIRSFGAIVPQLWQVGRALAGAVWRRPEAMAGTIRRVPFRFGAFDPADAGRRAAVTLGASLAPNGFALDTEADADVLLLHELAASDGGGNPEWPR